MNEILASSITIVVVNRNDGPVDGELLKVGTAMSVDLSVQVREDAALQQRILREVDASHNMAGLELLIEVGKQTDFPDWCFSFATVFVRGLKDIP